MIRGQRAVGAVGGGTDLACGPFLAVACGGGGAGRAALGWRCGGVFLVTSGGGWDEGRPAEEDGGAVRGSLGWRSGGVFWVTSGGCG